MALRAKWKFKKIKIQKIKVKLSKPQIIKIVAMEKAL